MDDSCKVGLAFWPPEELEDEREEMPGTGFPGLPSLFGLIS
jgi:hypothetical protein